MEASKEKKKSQSKPNDIGKDSFFSPSLDHNNLKVNHPRDQNEIEADNVAGKVVKSLAESEKDSSKQKPPNNFQNYLSSQSENNHFPIHHSSIIQTKSDADEKEKNQITEEGKIFRKTLSPISIPAIGNGEWKGSILMTKRSISESPPVSHETKVQLFASKGSGNPLPNNTQTEMERGFGVDFSKVRIHTGIPAISMSNSLGAEAFTHGSDIYFNSGKFDTHSQGGKKLLAHELTHVIQKSNLIQRGPDQDAKKKEKEKITKLKSDLKKAFSLKSVEDSSSNWTSEELRITKEALEEIPKGDIPSLKDVVLKRVSNLGVNTAGQFSSDQSVEDTTVTNEYELSIADLNFKQGTPEGEQKRLVQHEVGHAIASLPGRQATLESNKALADYNTKVNKQNESVVPFNEANDEFNAAVDDFNNKVSEYNNELEPSLKKQLKGEMDALGKIVKQKKSERAKKEKVFKVDKSASKAAKTTSEIKKTEAKKHAISQTDLDAIESSASSAKSSHDTALTQALGSITAEMKKPEQATQYLDALQALSTEIEEFHSETNTREKSETEVESMIAEVNKKMDARATAFESLSKADATHPLLTTLPTVESLQENFFHAAKANALAHERSARVQKFVAFVESNKIQPISDYARENWPHIPEEFYAEAYSFWISNKLSALSPDLQKWFDDKKYK
jgi:hypothetical protein